MSGLRYTGVQPIKGWYTAIPNAVSSVRILALPVLAYAAAAGLRGLFAWLLLIALLTDVLDGFLARTFHLESELGSRLDSIGDLGSTCAAVVGLCVFERPFLVSHPISVGLILGLLALEIGLAVP